MFDSIFFSFFFPPKLANGKIDIQNQNQFFNGFYRIFLLELILGKLYLEN